MITKNQNNITIGFIGLGLIGGSIAKAIRKSHPDYHIIVTSRSLAPLNTALEEKIIDEIIPCINERFRECNFIFLCTPVITIESHFSQLKNFINNSCILTDVGSVKTPIYNAAVKAGLEHNYIGGHPMCGSEHSGYAYSNADFLVNATYVITTSDYNSAESVESYVNLITDMKSHVIKMDCHEHDRAVAAISHVPHLIAASLSLMVKNNDNYHEHMKMLAAGGFRDTTRLAASSPEMWEQICVSNKEPILEMLDKYIYQLKDVRDHLDTENNEDIINYIHNLFSVSGDYRKTFYNSKK